MRMTTNQPATDKRRGRGVIAVGTFITLTKIGLIL
jgi:hypothetical protein